MRRLRFFKHVSPVGKLSPTALSSDINVTPLVDVCLVLLIIFMVVTPLLQKGVPVNLPVTRSPEKTPETAVSSTRTSAKYSRGRRVVFQEISTARNTSSPFRRNIGRLRPSSPTK